MDSEYLEYIYAIKCIYVAHAGDVRVLKPTPIPDGGILTGSWDTTTKAWAPEGKSFKVCNTFKGATTFIASLCVLPPSAQYPKGLFLAGSNDCSIYGFTPDSSEPILRLLGHSGTVCTLSYGKGDFIVSGSWDKTARVWSGQQCVLILKGHLEAVWATDVFPTQNLILTGSADHTIRLWREGVCETVFTGHEDCVRGLAIMSDMHFLSCSNDTTVRLWRTSGECLQVFKSHTDYIYSISLLNNGLDFATCGEDQNIKIWKNGVCIQTIVLAPKSLWDVACLYNGDLAVGTSNGKVYVFERVPKDHFERVSEVHDVSKSVDTPEHTTDSDVASDFKASTYSGEVILTYQNESNPMYVCQYNETGTKVKKEALDFQFIDDTFFKKCNEGSAENNTPQTKDITFVGEFYKESPCQQETVLEKEIKAVKKKCSERVFLKLDPYAHYIKKEKLDICIQTPTTHFLKMSSKGESSNCIKDTQFFSSNKDKGFICRTCQKEFPDYKSMLDHHCLPFECKQCLQKFEHKLKRKFHKCNNEGIKKGFKCSYCNSTFVTLSLFELHESSCSEKIKISDCKLESSPHKCSCNKSKKRLNGAFLPCNDNAFCEKTNKAESSKSISRNDASEKHLVTDINSKLMDDGIMDNEETKKSLNSQPQVTKHPSNLNSSNKKKPARSIKPKLHFSGNFKNLKQIKNNPLPGISKTCDETVKKNKPKAKKLSAIKKKAQNAKVLEEEMSDITTESSKTTVFSENTAPECDMSTNEEVAGGEIIVKKSTLKDAPSLKVILSDVNLHKEKTDSQISKKGENDLSSGHSSRESSPAKRKIRKSKSSSREHDSGLESGEKSLSSSSMPANSDKLKITNPTKKKIHHPRQRGEFYVKGKRFLTRKVKRENNIKFGDLLNTLPAQSGILLKPPTGSFHNFMCPKCNKLFKHLKTGSDHLISCRAKFKKNILIAFNEIIYVCTSCHYNSTKKVSLINHKVICTADSISDIILNYNYIKKQFTCPTCSFSCLSQQMYKVHPCTERLERMKTCIVNIKKIDPEELHLSDRTRIILDPIKYEAPDGAFLPQVAAVKAQIFTEVGNAFSQKGKKFFAKNAEKCNTVDDIMKNVVKPLTQLNTALGTKDSCPDLDVTLSYESQKLVAEAAEKYLSANKSNTCKEIFRIETPFDNDDSNDSNPDPQVQKLIADLHNYRCKCKKPQLDAEIEHKPCLPCLNVFVKTHFLSGVDLNPPTQDSEPSTSTASTSDVNNSNLQQEISVQASANSSSSLHISNSSCLSNNSSVNILSNIPVSDNIASIPEERAMPTISSVVSNSSPTSDIATTPNAEILLQSVISILSDNQMTNTPVNTPQELKQLNVLSNNSEPTASHSGELDPAVCDDDKRASPDQFPAESNKILDYVEKCCEGISDNETPSRNGETFVSLDGPSVDNVKLDNNPNSQQLVSTHSEASKSLPHANSEENESLLSTNSVQTETQPKLNESDLPTSSSNHVNSCFQKGEFTFTYLQTDCTVSSSELKMTVTTLRDIQKDLSSEQFQDILIDLLTKLKLITSVFGNDNSIFERALDIICENKLNFVDIEYKSVHLYIHLSFEGSVEYSAYILKSSGQYVCSECNGNFAPSGLIGHIIQDHNERNIYISKID